MCKAKKQVLYTYLIAALAVLTVAANHFNFSGKSASDAFLTESREVAAVAGMTGVEKVDAPAIAGNFAATPRKVAAVPRAGGVATTDNDTQGTITFRATRVTSPEVDAGTGVKIYQKMLYAHSTQAGNVFKSLVVGSRFQAVVDGETATYRVVARNVYARDYLNSDEDLRRSIYYYKGGLSLMTCGNGGNNDENYRLVLLAVKE